jgi:hypothetical protein
MELERENAQKKIKWISNCSTKVREDNCIIKGRGKMEFEREMHNKKIKKMD